MTLLVLSQAVICAEVGILFHEDFESGGGDFLINNDYGVGYGLWHHSTSCAVSQPGHTQGGALFYGLDDTCDFDNGRANRGVVDSPPIDLTNIPDGPIELQFNYCLEVEPAHCGYYSSGDVDLATVEISVDGGYFQRIARNCWKSGLDELPNTSGVWMESPVFDLTDYAGSVIQLRFGFNSVDYRMNNYDGFYVDDIVLYGPSCGFVILGDANDDCVVDLRDFPPIVDMVEMARNWLLNCYLTPSDPGCVPK